MIALRSATAADLERLSQLWYERAVLAPKPPGLALLPDARAQWETAASGWLGAPDYCLLVAAAGAEPAAGFIAGGLSAAPPGFAPVVLGEVCGLALDGHTYHAGAGRLLFNGLRAWFRERGVTQVVVTVPHASPVEQAFWRALRGAVWNDQLWLTL